MKQKQEQKNSDNIISPWISDKNIQAISESEDLVDEETDDIVKILDSSQKLEISVPISNSIQLL